MEWGPRILHFPYLLCIYNFNMHYQVTLMLVKHGSFFETTASFRRVGKAVRRKSIDWSIIMKSGPYPSITVQGNSLFGISNLDSEQSM